MIASLLAMGMLAGSMPMVALSDGEGQTGVIYTEPTPTPEVTATATPEVTATPTPEVTAEPTAKPDFAPVPQIPEHIMAVQSMINTLPTVEQLQAMDAEAFDAAYEQTASALEAYDALTEEEKALIGGLEIFEALFAVFNEGIAQMNETSGEGWEIIDGALHVTGRLNALPSGNNLMNYSSIVVDAGCELNLGEGGTDLDVVNEGTISGGEFSGNVANHAAINGGVISGTLYNRSKGTLQNAEISGSAANDGVIATVKFTGIQLSGKNPVQVMHNVNGEDEYVDYDAVTLAMALGEPVDHEGWFADGAYVPADSNVNLKYTIDRGRGRTVRRPEEQYL